MHPHPSQASQAAPPPNQPETPAERTARQLRACRDLTDLAVELAKAAAQESLQQTAQANPPTPTPPDPETTQPDTTRPNPALLFARLSRIALHAISLERRIAGDAEQKAANRPVWRTPDPRRPILTQALHQAAAGSQPNAAALCQEMDLQLDHELANDPDADTGNRDILQKICNGFGINIADRASCETYYPQLHAVLHNTS